MSRSIVVDATIIAKALIKPSVFGVSAVLEDGQGRVLLIRQTYSSGWHFPGGGVDRGEPPEQAIVRELEEEVGLAESTPPEFVGLYLRKILWVTNVVAFYRLRNVRVQFKRNIEIRAAEFFDPNALPEDTSAATRRRLAELSGKQPRTPYW
ncbi:MAG: NUDIX domain-containing protein [Rhizomicrobium sp.]